MKILIIDNYDSFTFNLYQYVGEILKGEVKGHGSRVAETRKVTGRGSQATGEFSRELSAVSSDHSSIVVKRNDEITVNEIKEQGFDRIIISPGPGDPSDKAYFGVCAEVLTEIGKTTPVMGVCLGMQGMAHYYGGKVVRAKLPMHGKTSLVVHDGKGFFKGLPQNIEVMRYHSLVAEPASLPECLEITAVVKSIEVTGRGSGVIGEFSSELSAVSREHSNIEIMGLRHKEYPVEGIRFHPESFATEGGKIMLQNFLFQ